MEEMQTDYNSLDQFEIVLGLSNIDSIEGRRLFRWST